MAEENGSQYIYATDRVRRAFDPALLNFLGEKAGKPLVIIGTEEIDISPIRKFWLKYASGLTEEQIAETTQNAIQDNLRQYMHAKYPKVELLQKFLDTATNVVQNNLPAAVISLDTTGGNYWDGGIIITRLDMTKTGLASLLSGLPESALKNFPGTDAEWMALTLMHEVGHILTNPINPSVGALESEIMADQAMVHLSRMALERGIIKTPGLAEAGMGRRALGVFETIDENHVTGPGVRTDNEVHAFKDSSVVMLSSLNLLRKKVFMAVGEPLMALSDTGLALKNALGNDALNIIKEDDRKLMEDAVSRIFSGISCTQEEIRSMLEPLGSIAKFELERAQDKISIEKGSNAMEADPHLKYETVRHLYEAGTFDDSPISKQYAKEFLQAAEKYAPEYFGVQNSPSKAADPLKRLGADAAPPLPDVPALTPKV